MLFLSRRLLDRTINAVGDAFEEVSMWGLKFIGNDDSRPPIPKPNESPDYTAQLQKIDPRKPVGIFIFAVDHKGKAGLFGDFAVNVSRNNFIDEVRKNYGDNFVVLDITAGFSNNEKQAAARQLEDFVKQFNQAMGDTNPTVHIVANHHQEQYDDNTLAKALAGLAGSRKRALILACGPDSKAYSTMPNFDFVIIPRPDGQFLAPDIDPYPSPGYRYVIGWMRNAPDAAAIREKFDSWFNWENTGSTARDWIAQKYYYGLRAPYLPPVVIDYTKEQPDRVEPLVPINTPALTSLRASPTAERR